MAIDANILLRGVVPDAGRAISQGIATGQQIKQAPLRNKLLELNAQQQEQSVASSELSLGQSAAVAAHQILGDTPADQVTHEQWGTILQTADRMGVPMNESQRPFTPENVTSMVTFGQAGKQIGMQKAGLTRRVQSTNNLGGGAVQIVYNDGSVEVVSSSDADKILIDQARKDEVKFIGDKAEAGSKGRVVGGVAGDIETLPEQKNVISELATSKESGTQKAKLRFAPQVAKAMKIAGAASDDQTKLDAKIANMPVINDMVADLRELSPLVTHTMAGKIWDSAVKETGFGSTKGATARASYQAIISNQILPLLRQTFGAAFTQEEGRKLEATLGDPDASPEQKMAQLDAFVSSQQGQVETLQRKLAPPVDEGSEDNPPVSVGRFQIKVKN